MTGFDPPIAPGGEVDFLAPNERSSESRGRRALSAPTALHRLSWLGAAVGFDVASMVLRLLPIDVASALGGLLFRWFAPWTPWDRTVRRNLELAFPTLGVAERDTIRDAYWAQFGRLAFEFPMLDRLTWSSGRIELVGLEQLRARSAAEPTVFITGHFSNFEVMAAAVIGAGFPCCVAYWRSENPYFDDRIRHCRERYGLSALASNGVAGARLLTRTVAQGGAIALLIDQRAESGVMAPFLGRAALCHPGPVRIALAAGAPLTPISIERLGGARFRVTIHEPIAMANTGQRQADIAHGVLRLNAFIEQQIRARPQEWFWSQRRWPEAMYASAWPGKG